MGKCKSMTSLLKVNPFCTLLSYYYYCLDSQQSTAFDAVYYVLHAKEQILLWCNNYDHANAWKLRCTNHTCQITVVTKFCMVVPYTCGSLVWCSLHVTVLEPRILRSSLRFQKICAHLLWRKDILFQFMYSVFKESIYESSQAWTHDI